MTSVLGVVVGLLVAVIVSVAEGLRGVAGDDPSERGSLYLALALGAVAGAAAVISIRRGRRGFAVGFVAAVAATLVFGLALVLVANPEATLLFGIPDVSVRLARSVSGWLLFGVLITGLLGSKQSSHQATGATHTASGP
jgi:hypothetical protein